MQWKKFGSRLGRWWMAAVLGAVLTGCGGGGGGGDGEEAGAVGGGLAGGEVVVAPPPPDARSGDYTMLAADGREYTLNLDFDAATWRIAGTDFERAGSFTAGSHGEFHVTPSNSVGAEGTTTLRFTQFSDTVVGTANLPTGVRPFLASRSMATSVAAIAGTYNMLGREVYDDGNENTSIQQGEITASGELRICEHIVIYTVDICPPEAIWQGPVTVEGTLFTSHTPGGPLRFRVLNVAGEHIFVRASASTTTRRRFMVGTPAGPVYHAGVFRSGGSDASWGTDTVTTNAYGRDAVLPDGQAVTFSGGALSVHDGSNSLGNLRSIGTATAGGFFSVRSAELVVVAASRDSAHMRGFFAIGRRQ